MEPARGAASCSSKRPWLLGPCFRGNDAGEEALVTKPAQTCMSALAALQCPGKGSREHARIRRIGCGVTRPAWRNGDVSPGTGRHAVKSAAAWGHDILEGVE